MIFYTGNHKDDGTSHSNNVLKKGMEILNKSECVTPYLILWAFGSTLSMSLNNLQL